MHFGFTPDNRFTFGFYENDLMTTNIYPDSEWHHWAGTFDTNGNSLSLVEYFVFSAQ